MLSGARFCGEMSDRLSFSVVTPSFGQLPWLELCIASVADQAGVGPVEHIVCDGGSPGIEEFTQRMKQRFPETPRYSLRFKTGPDAGMYDAINQGLRLASGDVCSYLNCDEQYLPGALATVQRHFLGHPRDEVLFGDTIVVNHSGEALCYWRPYVPSLAHLMGASLNTLSCSTFFRRSVIVDGHLFDPKWKAVGDMLWIRSLCQAERPMVCLRQPLAAFAFLGDNLGASATAEAEFHRSRQETSVASRVARRGIHGLRKLLSGAYVHRSVAYDVFALSDPMQRRRYTHDRLGWTWPRAGRKQADA